MQDDETLASVRAFLDAFDVHEAVDHEPKVDPQPPANLQRRSSPIRDTSTSSDDSSNQETLDWRAAGYSTLLQRRKRSEIVALREASKELEERLLMLHRAAASGGEGAAKTGGEEKTWVDLEENAARELRARRRAELANKQLKARLERQAQLREDIGKLIDKHHRQESADAGSSILGDLSVPFTTTVSLPVTVWRGSRAASDGTEMLQSMYEQIDAVCGPCGPDELSSCSIETIAREDCTEIRTSTISECSVEEAMELHWRKAPNERYPKIGSILLDEVSPDGNSYVMDMQLPLHVRALGGGEHSGVQLVRIDGSNPDMVEVKLHLRHYARRIREASTGRAIVLRQAIVRVPAVSPDLLIREFMWTRVTPTGNGSLTQLCYRVMGEETKSEELKVMQASIIHSLLLHTRQNHARLQNWLLDAAFAT